MRAPTFFFFPLFLSAYILLRFLHCRIEFFFSGLTPVLTDLYIVCLVSQLSNILKDPEATDNDRFVALELLKNANIAAGMVLPSCQVPPFPFFVFSLSKLRHSRAVTAVLSSTRFAPALSNIFVIISVRALFGVFCFVFDKLGHGHCAGAGQARHVCVDRRRGREAPLARRSQRLHPLQPPLLTGSGECVVCVCLRVFGCVSQ